MRFTRPVFTILVRKTLSHTAYLVTVLNEEVHIVQTVLQTVLLVAIDFEVLAPAVRNSEVYQSLLQKEFDIMKHVQHPGFINPIYICPAPGIRENKNINILFFCLAIFFSFHNVFASPHLHAKRYFHRKHF